MAHSERSPASFDPASFHQEMAIGSLGISSLAKLRDVLSTDVEPGANTDWLKIVTAERLSRIDDIMELRNQRPLPESPAYNPNKGPAKYLSDVRKHNIQDQIYRYRIGSDLPDQKAFVTAVVARHARSAVSKIDRSKSDVSQSDLTEFFISNAQGVLLGSLTAITQQYKKQQYAALQACIPEASIGNRSEFRTHVRRSDVSRGQLIDLQRAIRAIPYRLSTPNFFKMSGHQQNDVLAQLTVEWTELCELLVAHNPDLLTVGVNRRRSPLAYCAVDELREAIANSAPLTPAEVCEAFLTTKRLFSDHLVEIKERTVERQRLADFKAQQAARRKEEHRQQMEAAAAAAREAAVQRTNIGRIQSLIKDENVNDSVLDAQMGEPVLITEANKPIPLKDFEDVVDKHIELIGRALWENTEDKSPDGLQLRQWPAFNVGKAIRGAFNGRLQNLKITRLPVSEEELAEVVESPQAIKNVVRLLLELEMKSSGKPPEGVLLTMLLSISRPAGRKSDVLYKLKKGARTTAMQVAESLHMDSVATAWAIESEGKQRPLRTGLPGLGIHSKRS